MGTGARSEYFDELLSSALSAYHILYFHYVASYSATVVWTGIFNSFSRTDEGGRGQNPVLPEILPNLACGEDF